MNLHFSFGLCLGCFRRRLRRLGCLRLCLLLDGDALGDGRSRRFQFGQPLRCVAGFARGPFETNWIRFGFEFGFDLDWIVNESTRKR